MLSRRDFLSRSALVALAPTVPAFLARTVRAAAPQRDGRVLVVIQLDGGNDGLNTVVPFADEGYARYRKRLRLPGGELIKINDQVALHPSLRDTARLMESRRLTVVQGVGYPNPSRSHARSMAVWHTARFDPEEHNGFGWIGHALDRDAKRSAGVPSSMFVGVNAPPLALRGRRCVTTSLARLEDFRLTREAAALGGGEGGAPAEDLTAFVHRSLLDAYTTAERLNEVSGTRDGGAAYPPTALARRLQLVARLLKAGFATRVYYTTQPGYDTHAAQLFPHANLLEELAGTLRAFVEDLAAARLLDRVLVLAFSEFGRTVRENASAGTDHGTAGPVFLAGPGVRGGLAGAAPSLSDLQDGEPKMTVDFRRVYATVLEDWLGLPGQEALGGAFERLPLLRG